MLDELIRPTIIPAAAFEQHALIEHQDAIGIPQAAEAVGHDQDGVGIEALT